LRFGGLAYLGRIRHLTGGAQFDPEIRVWPFPSKSQVSINACGKQDHTANCKYS